MLNKLPIFTRTIERWLKATSTGRGTPQEGPISPMLMNVALDGMERLFGYENSRGNRVSASSKTGLNKGVTLVRYADDFVVIAPTKERLESYVLPKVQTFLKQCGLTLSQKKTRIIHLNERFDFLGFTFIRQGGKLLTKPSKKAVNAHIKQIKAYLRSHVQVPTLRVMKELTRVIRGWINYYRHGASRKIFNKISHRTFELLWKWACRRHRNKPSTWVRQKYFRADWAFHSNALLRHNQVPVTRFVTGKCSPLNPDEAEYWRTRRNKRHECLTYKEVDRTLHRRQEYSCTLCGIAFEENDNINHIQSRSRDGNEVDNLKLVHTWCRKAYHTRRTAQA